ncbi:MAG: hypothetical protein ABI045_05635 [Flavobacteriales bacterium]
MVLTYGATTTKTVFQHPDFAEMHFTGSTAVFRQM